MPTISATVSSTSITLNDGNPYRILSARGMGGAEIRRVTSQGPAQDGDTDEGYRLQPREIELVIGFEAATDILLDGYRDTLTSFFKPLAATPIKLRIVRDDGEIRQIDCNLVGSIDIDLVPRYRPGHYHRATVRLRAADPAWYELAPGTVSYSGTVPLATWWLANGAVGTAQHLMHGGTPAANEAWSYSGTIGTATGFTLMIRADYVSYLNPNMFLVDAPSLPLTYAARFGVAGTATWGTANPYYMMGASQAVLGNLMGGAGIHNYALNSDPGIVYIGGNPAAERATSWIIIGGGYVNLSELSSIVGTTQFWRTSSWPGTVQLYALYSPPLSESQRNAVSAYMEGIVGVGGTVNQVVSLPYEGDLPEYPTITITGPIANPIITNAATSEVLDFTGTTLGAGTTYIIDTRYGYKQVLQGTVIRNDKLSDDSDLGTWHIAPAPIATGGTNVISVNGSGASAATAITVVYYNRYQSY